MAIRDVVKVDWVDAVGQSQWRDRRATENDLRPGACCTYGEVLQETEEYLTVVASVDTTNENVGHVECIPRSAIRQVEVLKKGEQGG